MPRAVIVHGWDGSPEEGWFPWFARELEAHGFAVTIPEMRCQPPKMSVWVPQLAEVVGVPDEDTYLIGHSAGCITILRYLEQLPEGVRVGGVVLVAGFTDDLGYEELRNYFTTPIAWERIRATAAHGVVAIHSDNDRYVPLTHGDVFRARLGAEVIVLHDRKHFEGGSGIRELPEARDAILRLVRWPPNEAK